MKLSPHFVLNELARSQMALRKGIDNSPPPQAVDELRRLCADVLEPARSLLGVPLQISSGYRCIGLNVAVGSTAKRSAHMYGRAADLVPLGIPLREAFDKIRASVIPFDQLIMECDAWLHISIAAPGVKPRRMAMTATGKPGAWKYQAVGA